MNTIRRRILVVAAASMLAAIAVVLASHSQSSTGSTPLEIEKDVLAQLTAIQNAARALDPEKVFSFVLENERGALVEDGKFFLTRKDALESARLGFQGLRKVDYSFDQQHITLLSPTVALATGDGWSSASTVDGKPLRTRFAQSVVFVLTNGEWKVFHAHRSFPAAE